MGDWDLHTYIINVLMCSVVVNSLRPHWTVSHQVLLSMEFSRQEYWSGWPFLSPIHY